MRKHGKKLMVLSVALASIAGVIAFAAQDGKVQLPDAVKKVLDTAYAGAAVEEVEVDSEGIQVYEVELKQNAQEMEVGIALDGTVVEEAVEIDLDAVPAEVKAAIEAAANGAEIEEVIQETTYYVVTLKKLVVPEVTYEAEIIVDGQEIEVELNADGTILEEGTDDDGNGGDDADNGEEGDEGDDEGADDDA